MTYIPEYYTKQNVSFHEYQMHKYIYDLSQSININVPRIINYNIESKTLIMEKINHMNISDYYGENINNIDNNIIDKIRDIITILYDHNIVYPDITGYNFIEHDGQIWIIDFEHASFMTNKKDTFVEEFINGLHSWNPRFL